MRKNSRCSRSQKYAALHRKLFPSPLFLAAGLLSAAGVQAGELQLLPGNAKQFIDGVLTVSKISVADHLGATLAGDSDSLLLYTGASEDFQLGATSAGSTGVNRRDSRTGLDLSRIQCFEFDNQERSFEVGGMVRGNIKGDASADMVLAKENQITARAVLIGTADRAASGYGIGVNRGNVELGQINHINTDELVIGASQAAGGLSFGEGSDATLRLRASNGSGRVGQWRIGVDGGSDYANTDGFVGLAGGTLDARVQRLLIGQQSAGNSSTDGILEMHAGVLDAHTITLGQHDGGPGNGAVRGLLLVVGGNIVARELLLGDNASATATVSGRLLLDEDATLRVGTISGGRGSATRNIEWFSGTIGNYAEDAELRITGVDIKLTGGDAHTFDIAGSNGRAIVSAVIANIDNTLVDGWLRKTGSGTLILEADNTYTGGTTVNAGTLAVNGALSASDTVVNQGGTLAGSGRVQAVRIGAGGAFSNAMGALTVAGDLSFDSAGIYRAKLGQDGAMHTIHVQGAAALAGTLEIQAGDGSFEKNREFILLTSDTNISNRFSQIDNRLAFLDAALDYGERDVTLTLARNARRFADVASSANQQSVAQALDTVAAAASGDRRDVLNAVTSLSEEQARASYDSISGAGLTAAQRSGQIFATGFDRQLHARLAALPASQSATLAATGYLPDPTAMAAAAPAAAGHPRAGDSPGFWLRAYGGQQIIKGDRNAAGIHDRANAVAAGFDTRLNDEVVAGIAYSHGRNRFNSGNNESGSASSNALALYTSYIHDGWAVRSALSFSRHRNHTRRQIAFGSIERTANADFASQTWGLSGEIAYAIPLSNWLLQPLAGLALNYHAADRIRETGADSLNLLVDQKELLSAQSQIGVKALIGTAELQWQPRLAWTHQFGNSNAAMSAQLQDSGGAFNIRGIAVPRDALLTGLSISASGGKQVRLFADVQHEFNRRQSSLGLFLGARMYW